MKLLAAVCVVVFFAVSGCQDRPPKPRTAAIAASFAEPAHA